MTTLANFLTKKNPKGVFYWLKFYWFHLLEFAYSKRVSNKVDTWKGIKVKSSHIPEGWNKENSFKYLQEQYSKENRIMKRFAD